MLEPLIGEVYRHVLNSIPLKMTPDKELIVKAMRKFNIAVIVARTEKGWILDKNPFFVEGAKRHFNMDDVEGIFDQAVLEYFDYIVYSGVR